MFAPVGSLSVVRQQTEDYEPYETRQRNRE